MIYPQIGKNQKGVASSWSLIVLVALIVVLGAAIYLWFPRPQVIEPKPVVTRMKIPSVPSPAPSEPAKDQQETPSATEATAPLEPEENVIIAASEPNNQTVAPSDSDNLPAGPEEPLDQPFEASDAVSHAATGDQNPALATVPAPEPTPVDSAAQSRAPAENAQTEETPSDGAPETSVSGEPESTKPIEPVPAESEKEKETDSGDATPTESPSPEAKDTPSSASAEDQKPFSVQVGVYHGKGNADKMASGLKALGYASFIHESQDKRQRPLYKVCFGRFESKREAAQAAATFKEKEEQPALIVRLGPR